MGVGIEFECETPGCGFSGGYMAGPLMNPDYETETLKNINPLTAEEYNNLPAVPERFNPCNYPDKYSRYLTDGVFEAYHDLLVYLSLVLPGDVEVFNSFKEGTVCCCLNCRKMMYENGGPDDSFLNTYLNLSDWVEDYRSRRDELSTEEWKGLVEFIKKSVDNLTERSEEELSGSPVIIDNKCPVCGKTLMRLKVSNRCRCPKCGKYSIGRAYNYPTILYD